MTVSLIVPCRNEVDHIERFLDDVVRQEGIADDLEILITDGMSTDGTRELVASRARVDRRIILLDNPQQTASHALNRAIESARGNIIVRMDVHTEYAPDYVRLCVDTLIETRADNVGGPARTRSRSYFQRANSLAYHSPFSVGGARFHRVDYEGYVDTVVYGCWWRSIFERLGPFDTELVRNMDDEFNLRIVRGGGRLWQNPRIRSWYFPRAGCAALMRQYMQYGYWKVRVIQKHRVPASWRHLVPATFMLLLGLGAIGAPFSETSRMIFLSLAGLYFAASLLASVVTCLRPHNWRYLPVMPAVFAAYHFGYGIGFLGGIWDFMIRRKGPRRALTALTR